MTAPGTPARIHDQGYVRYDGPRTGVTSAMRSVVARTGERALGLRRRASTKVLPILAAMLAYLPAIVFVGISVFTKDQPYQTKFQLLPTYGQYYGFVWGAILVFTAFVVPGVLCSDQRNGMFGLYLASPLNRTTYLISKASGVFIVLALSTIGPLLMLLIAYSLNEIGPDGFGDFMSVLGKIVLSGSMLTLFYLGFSFAMSSITTRWAAASASIIVTFFATSVLTSVLIRRGRAAPELFLLDLTLLPMELVLRIFDDTYSPTSPRYAAKVSTPTIAAAIAGWILVFAVFTWVRYRRIEVTR